MKKVLVFALILGVSMFFVPSAFAIPAGQKQCSSIFQGFSGPPQILPLQVQARIGLIPNICVLTLSMEAFFPEYETQQASDILWSIDGGQCQPINSCPTALTSETSEETHTIVCPVFVGPGVHNFAPCVTTNGPTVNIGNACLTIECQTK